MNIKIKYQSKLKLIKDHTEVQFLKDKTSNENIKSTSEKKVFEENKILLKSINDKSYIFINISKIKTSTDFEKIGSKLYDFSKKFKIYNLILNSLISKLTEIQTLRVIHGFKLKSYEFGIYKTSNAKKQSVFNITVIQKKKINSKLSKKLDSIAEGVFYARDLVSEPGNILHPDEYAKRLTKLRKLGLKVNVYDQKKLKKMGFNALLGVGQGSIRGSYLVTIEWNGNKSQSKPLAFVGKGVCFDTGGISLKPAKFMEDMTYDMAGSAVVVGLMKNFALRKAKIKAVGVVGLVENMPGGNAQRPGDIVKSYSGKTIEVLNTDAEGRLVLADALTYTEKKFSPKLIIDLATLTGAIIVSLGSEYAGLFSNNDKLSDEIYKAGNNVDEKVWRMPLHENYNKLIDSKNADVQNINYVGGAGSTTAAQFLQRFILNKTPWAHLDIAGMSFSKYAGALNSGGATGYGVRLLNKFVEDNYE